MRNIEVIRVRISTTQMQDTLGPPKIDFIFLPTIVVRLYTHDHVCQKRNVKIHYLSGESYLKKREKKCLTQGAEE